MGAVKVVKLRGTSNELLATALQVGEVGRLGRCRQWLRCIMCLWAELSGMIFIPDLLEDHKSTLCGVACGGGGDAFFGAPWCNCFVAITVTKNAALEPSTNDCVGRTKRLRRN